MHFFLSRYPSFPFLLHIHARSGIEAKQPNSAIRKCARVQLIKNGKKIAAFVPMDGCLNFVEENVSAIAHNWLGSASTWAGVVCCSLQRSHGSRMCRKQGCSSRATTHGNATWKCAQHHSTSMHLCKGSVLIGNPTLNTCTRDLKQILA